MNVAEIERKKDGIKISHTQIFREEARDTLIITSCVTSL